MRFGASIEKSQTKWHFSSSIALPRPTQIDCGQSQSMITCTKSRTKTPKKSTLRYMSTSSSKNRRSLVRLRHCAKSGARATQPLSPMPKNTKKLNPSATTINSGSEPNRKDKRGNGLILMAVLRSFSKLCGPILGRKRLPAIIVLFGVALRES